MSFLLGSILLYFFFTNFVSVIDYSLYLGCPKTQYSIITICRKSVENFAAFARMECHLESIQTTLKTPMNCFLTIEIPKKDFKHIKTQYNFAQFIVHIIYKIKN